MESNSGRPVGRPPFYEKVEDLQKAIDGYFESLKPSDLPKGFPVDLLMHPTITGLALYLGFNSRQAIINYEHKEEFNDAIKKAKLRIEMNYEQALFNKNAAGPIFALKNFGWSDKREIEVKGTTINFTDAG